jgi:WS/DGAT/MGAT family acyltransferase
MLGRGLLGVPRQPVRALRSLPRTLPNVLDLPGANALPLVPRLTKGLAGLRRLAGAELPEGLLEVTAARAPRTSFNGPISPHRRYSFGSLSLDDVKAVKNALGHTVNDVVVALCTTTVRRWLLDHDELPDEPLLAMVPMSVRTPEQYGTFGNRVSVMIVPIPTNEADPRRRLERTHELLRSAKERHKALPADILTDATNFIPPALAARAARTTVDVLSRTRPPLNLVISNVPGPRTPLYLAGARLEAHHPVSVIVDGVGLNITVMSYRDNLDFGIVADRWQVDDAWPLLQGARDALDELLELACGRPRRVTRPPRAPRGKAATTAG